MQHMCATGDTASHLSGSDQIWQQHRWRQQPWQVSRYAGGAPSHHACWLASLHLALTLCVPVGCTSVLAAIPHARADATAQAQVRGDVPPAAGLLRDAGARQSPWITCRALDCEQSLWITPDSSARALKSSCLPPKPDQQQQSLRARHSQLPASHQRSPPSRPLLCLFQPQPHSATR